MALLVHQQAWADCTPDPTQTGMTTTCSGLDANGLVVTSSGSSVNVLAASTVEGAGAPAIQIAMPDIENFAVRTSTIQIDGAVVGRTNAGIAVTPGPSPYGYYDFYGSAASITIGSSGTVNGSAGITTVASAGNPYGKSTIELDNSGTISATGGAALTTDAYGAFTSILNRETGVIGGIAAQFGTIENRGTINGSVTFTPNIPNANAGATYVAAGGTLNGDLRFGSANDFLIETGAGFGVSGTKDGGAGTDMAAHVLSKGATVVLGDPSLVSFERELVIATGADTVVTAVSANSLSSDLTFGGSGQIVNRVSTSGRIWGTTAQFEYFSFPDAFLPLASFRNEADVGGINLQTHALANTATVRPVYDIIALNQYATGGPITFSNSGTIVGNGGSPAVSVTGFTVTDATISNSGSIQDGLYAYLDLDGEAASRSVAFNNSGTITRAGTGYGAVTINTDTQTFSENPQVAISIANSGTIEATAVTGHALDVRSGENATISIDNSGIIRANGGGYYNPDPYAGASVEPALSPAVAVDTRAFGNLTTTIRTTATVTNTATGLIEATGALSSAIYANHALTVLNAGTITGTQGSSGTVNLAGAIQAGASDDVIENSGTINGSIDLGGGNDTIVNTGTLNGTVLLGAGDDAFTQRISATLTGTVYGGAGSDIFNVDATGSGTIAGAQVVGFERLIQTGSGSATWSGNFDAPVIDLDGSTLIVAAGDALQTSSITATVVGGNGAETVSNAGAIAAAVFLGAGDDTYRDFAGSSVHGSIDGGDGNDTYNFVLSGDRAVTRAGIHFENLDVTGSGTLQYTLNQSFDEVRLAATGLNLALNGQSIGQVEGTAQNETVSVDGDLARVALGDGNDTLTLSTAVGAGRYEGGAGSDTLTFAATAPITLTGSAAGFETLVLGSNALTVTGTLGAAGDNTALTDANETVILANGGTIAGTLNLGAGSDTFRLQRGGTLLGSIDGGAGDDAFTLDTGGPYTLTEQVSGFERFALGGNALTIAGKLSSAGGTIHFDDGDATIIVAPGGSLAGTIVLGAGNDRLTIAGAFAGSVDGGAGNDAILVSGGSPASPVAFGSITNVENYAQSGGVATVAGTAALGSASLSGGRLVGLAGSTINASGMTVQQGATFGSAGTVNANIAVAGTLSPGASPGTMTVNGNVSLGATSVSLFEITPSVSDKLIISGTLSIAQGATLQLAPSGTIQPGRTLDLIVTGGSISGSFTNVVKPDSLFGVVVQSANKIQLLGQFLSDPSFSPQVQASIAYTNATLVAQPSTSALLAALPALAPNGVTDAAAFARLTPEPYASATQLSVERGLVVARAARALNFAPSDDTPHAFTFAQALGDWSSIDASAARGTSRAKSNGYGFLGGIGFAASEWAIGGFVGYLNEDQTISALGAKTKTDGVVAGVHVRYDTGAFAASGSVFYDGADANTRRVLPVSGSADSDYHLRGLGFDGKLAARLGVGNGLAVTPQIGTTWIRTRRSGTVEGGGSPFALTVEADRQWAGFADASLKIEGADTARSALRPWATVGARYQLRGRRPLAVAGFAGGTSSLAAAGAPRARLAGTLEAGLDAHVAPSVDLFVSGNGELAGRTKRAGVSGGIRVSF